VVFTDDPQETIEAKVDKQTLKAQEASGESPIST
jgi:hypothetical protein